MTRTEESLKRQLNDIDRMLSECQDKKNLDRLVEHLKGRRDVTVRELEKVEQATCSLDV